MFIKMLPKRVRGHVFFLFHVFGREQAFRRNVCANSILYHNSFTVQYLALCFRTDGFQRHAE
jgi:hypothetical protein